MLKPEKTSSNLEK